MWTAKEAALISETLDKYDIEDILTSEELDAIPSSALKNIRSTVIEPKHKHKVRFHITIKFGTMITWFLVPIIWFLGTNF